MKLNKTPIDWVKNPDGTQGYTWNPITGCLNGCPYCYARKLANGQLRSGYLANHNFPNYLQVGFPHTEDALLDPFYPRFWEDRLEQPKGARIEAGIFTCDMGELFGDWIPEGWQEQIFKVIEFCGDCRFYLLTKQPQNLIKFSPFPENCWVGVTATNREQFTLACTHLIGIQATVKFISFEPLLQRILLPEFGEWGKEPFDWLIIGAQTRPFKPPDLEWVYEIVEAADRAGVSVFLKNNLELVIPFTTMFRTEDRKLRQEMPT